jgi:hypothetical protein
MSLISCILSGSIFLRDKTSSLTWQFASSPFSFFVAVAHLNATFFAFKFFGLFRGLILLWWTLVSSVLFPAIVNGVSIERPEAMARDYMSNLCDTGRAFHPLIFGFRMTLPYFMFGPSAFMALLLVEAIQPLFSHVPIGFAMKPWFPGSSSSRIVEYILLFLVGSALMDLPPESLGRDGETLRLVGKDFLNIILGETGRLLFAILTVIATNLFIWSLSQLGMRLANKLLEWHPVRLPGTLLVNNDSSVGGSVIVAAWVAVIVFIAAT